MEQIPANPVHTYANFGTYTVKLIATNTSGCTDTVIKVNAIVVNKIKASFTIADTVCQQQRVVFNNNSTPAPISTYWSFGDGTYSSKINPIKTYDSAGTYQVKLVSNYGDCADSAIKTITVSAKPVAIFISDAAISCKSPLLVHFTNQSLNAIAYQWNFGDGTQSTTQNPTHAFNGNGSFSVQLIALNANGCSDTILKKDIVTIQKPVVSQKTLPVQLLQSILW
jgi:PKD repeat protein